MVVVAGLESDGGSWCCFHVDCLLWNIFCECQVMHKPCHMQHTATHCVAVCCSVLQCVAVCQVMNKSCHVQHTATHCVAVCCSVLQCVVGHE